jgi:hypothetical protein
MANNEHFGKRSSEAPPERETLLRSPKGWNSAKKAQDS